MIATMSQGKCRHDQRRTSDGPTLHRDFPLVMTTLCPHATLIGDADLATAATQRAGADLEEQLGRALATMSEDTRLEALATGAALVGYLEYLEHQLAADSTPGSSVGPSPAQR